MKTPAAPSKRSARARIVELNGPAEQVELLLAIFTVPLWGIIFPLIGIATIGTVGGIFMVGASVFCLLHCLHLLNGRFSFEENGLRLPGVDHRLLAYANFHRIYLEEKSPVLLVIEFYPYKGLLGQKTLSGSIRKQLFEVQHLTEESARQLWSLFALHLQNCVISQDVRESLVNWRTLSNKHDNNASSAAAFSKGHPIPDVEADSALARSSFITRDLSMTVELKPINPIKLIGQYLVSYSDTFRKTWLTFWMAIAAFAYPLTIFALVTKTVEERQIINSSGHQFKDGLSVAPLTDAVLPQLENLQKTSIESLAAFFGNHIGAIGLFVLIYLAIYKIYQHSQNPDSIFIDYMGITTQKRTTHGVRPKEHRSWKSIDTIKLVRPNEHSNSSRWSILFECNQDKIPIEIPFKAFSNDRIRQQFLECLDTWGREINIDTKFLEALSPRSDTSYTELWLSGLSQAPKIDEMTPHSIGLKLRSHAYEIVSQLASGGQGVTYLAKKLPPADTAHPETTAMDEEQVVLKETVLPIFVDDRAKAKAIARFERDAKLLASLNHPLIVRLEDFFVESSRAYLALEYIPGKTLKEKVESEGPFSEADVHKLALMMVDIVEYLHDRTPPVVHRDFTPDNLILTADGKIKLIDFDVALEQNSFAQGNATIVGKQAYIPLEQFRGKPCPQSDIYAIGATLAYLLTGLEPEALQASHPKQLRTEISTAFDQIVADATAVELPDRLSGARAMSERLLEISKAEAI